MNIAGVMDELGAALETIGGLQVFPYWADRVTPPAAVVGWPDSYSFDATYGRGSDRITVPVTVLVGRVTAATSRDRLAAYADGSGPSSVKQAVDGHASSAYDTATVREVTEFATYTVAGVEYLGARFSVDIMGSGN